MPVVGDAACAEKYGPIHKITENMICAGLEEGTFHLSIRKLIFRYNLSMNLYWKLYVVIMLNY